MFFPDYAAEKCRNDMKDSNRDEKTRLGNSDHFNCSGSFEQVIDFVNDFIIYEDDDHLINYHENEIEKLENSIQSKSKTNVESIFSKKSKCGNRKDLSTSKIPFKSTTSATSNNNNSVILKKIVSTKSNNTTGNTSSYNSKPNEQFTNDVLDVKAASNKLTDILKPVKNPNNTCNFSKPLNSKNLIKISPITPKRNRGENKASETRNEAIKSNEILRKTLLPETSESIFKDKQIQDELVRSSSSNKNDHNNLSGNNYNVSNKNPKKDGKEENEEKPERVNPMRWKTFPSPEEIKLMHRVQLGPYYQYADPPQASKNTIMMIKKKLRHEKLLRNEEEGKTYNDEHAKWKYSIVVGRLKAADARQRIHVVMLNFASKMDMKLNKMVFVQPTGLMAVRTEYLIRSRPLEYLPGGKFNPISKDPDHYMTLKEKSRLKTLLNEIIL